MRESKREMEGGSWAPWNERVGDKVGFNYVLIYEDSHTPKHA